MELVVGSSANGRRVVRDYGIDDLGILGDAQVSQNGVYAQAESGGTGQHGGSVEGNVGRSSSQPGTSLAMVLTNALYREVSTEQLYELIYAEMAETLLGWCRKRMSNTMQALNGMEPEDLSQRVWLQVWRFLSAFDHTRSDNGTPGGRLITWVYLIAANTHTDWYRHHTVLKHQTLQLEVDSYRPVRYKSMTITQRRDQRIYRQLFTDQDRTPEEQVLSRDYAVHVDAECRKVLTKQQYDVLKLRAEGLSYDEMSVVFGTTRAAVKSTLFRARIAAAKVIGVAIVQE